MNAIVPTFRTRDYESARKFYVEELRFQVNRELQLTDPDGNRLRICTVQRRSP